jgi:uncharacterized membrane protein
MKKSKIIIICLILLSIVLTCFSFGFLEDIIPIHFDINGNPDMQGSKYFMLIFPLVNAIIGISIILTEKYAKVSDNYKKYLFLTGIFMEFIFTILNIVFMVYVLMYAEDVEGFDISKIMMVIFGLMFIIMGNFMPKIEKNRTLGIKTKWSMYNETTWQKTHRFTGYVGVIVGILVLILGIFFKEKVNFIILMSLILLFGVTTTIQSYYYYKKEITKEQLNN